VAAVEQENHVDGGRTGREMEGGRAEVPGRCGADEIFGDV